MEEPVTPKCLSCDIGQLVPLSDYGGQGASVHYKAWVCTNPPCGFNIKIRNGDHLSERADQPRQHERSQSTLVPSDHNPLGASLSWFSGPVGRCVVMAGKRTSLSSQSPEIRRIFPMR